MKTTISDLSPDLVEEILSRAPLTSLSAVRSTSKQWNALSRDRIVCKAEAKQQVLGFMAKDLRVYSVRFDLQNDDFVDPSIKKTGKLDQFEICSVFHCDGLVLCVTNDYKSLVVWNPYLGQTRLIELMNYKNMFCFGYDSSHSYKILRSVDKDEYFESAKRRIVEYEIYDFDSDSWRILDVTPDWYIDFLVSNGVSLKGNTYWIAQDRRKTEEDWEEEELPDDFLLCFDFTRERFGPRLKLPFRGYFYGTGALACVREEQLAVMFQHSDSYKMEILVTTKIEPEFVSWSKFLVFDMTPSQGLRCCVILHGSFFIDEEKKVAMLFYLSVPKNPVTPSRNIAYMIGEDGYYMEVDLGQSSRYGRPIVCSYVPSLKQIE